MSCPIIVDEGIDLATRPSNCLSVPELFGVFSIPIGLSSNMGYFYSSPKRNARSRSREWVDPVGLVGRAGRGGDRDMG